MIPRPQVPADSKLRIAECVCQLMSDLPGIVEMAIYGSLVRGDFVPGCSDLDIFIVVSQPFLDAGMVSRRLGACLALSGLRVRGVDVAWCYLDDIFSQKCNYKFLTIYRDDFERNSIIHGKPAHHIQQPHWSPQARCRHLIELARKNSMQHIAAGEAIKLMLAIQGYQGPWDKYSILQAVREKLGRFSYDVWTSYISCKKPPNDCVENIIESLEQKCDHA